MSIIIKTPQPDTEERLVLVPPESVSRSVEGVSQPGACDLAVHTNNARDATPADLARGGFTALEPGEMVISAPAFRELKLRAEGREAHGEPGTLAHLRADLRDAVRRAEHAEQLTSELQATIARAFSYIEHTPGVQYLDAEVKKLGERAEKAERVAAMAKDIDGHTMADLRDDLRNASARYDEVWAALGTTSALANDTAPNIILAMREDIAGLNADVARLHARAEKAEREREEAKELARVLEVERDTLRAELARLTAPGEGSAVMSSGLTEAVELELMRIVDDAIGPLPEIGVTLVCRGHASGAAHTVSAAAYRLGVAHERARQQPAKDRATDDELVAIAETAYEAAGRGRGGCVEAAALAVAARVRQERCLVAQAVAMGVSLEIGPHSKGVDIHASRPRENADGGEFFEGELVEAGRDDVPPSEASATLARMLGEVGRG